VNPRRSIPAEIYFVVLMILAVAGMRIWGTSETLDPKFYYTGQQARDFFAGQSPVQAYKYLHNELFDLGFLCSYTILLFLLYRRVFTADSYVTLIAFLPGIFDLVETSTIIQVLLKRFVDEAPTWLGITTCLKWSTAGVAILFLAFGFVKHRRPRLTDNPASEIPSEVTS